MKPELTNHDLVTLFRSLQAILDLNLVGCCSNGSELSQACGHISHRFETQGKHEGENNDTESKTK